MPDDKLSDIEQEALGLLQRNRRSVGFVYPEDFDRYTLYTEQRDGEVVAAALVEHDAGTSILHALAVDSRWRGGGIGEALVENALAESPTGGLETKVQADLRANQFYEKTGWEFVRTTNDERMNVWKLEK